MSAIFIISIKTIEYNCSELRLRVELFKTRGVVGKTAYSFFEIHRFVTSPRYSNLINSSEHTYKLNAQKPPS